MVRRVRRPRGKVNEERFIGSKTLLLADPRHRLVGHVLHEVVAFLGRLLRLYRRGSLVERRVPFIGLATNESVEVLEAPAAGGPGIERPGRARLPDWYFVALAELRCGVAIKFQRPCQ